MYGQERKYLFWYRSHYMMYSPKLATLSGACTRLSYLQLVLASWQVPVSSTDENKRCAVNMRRLMVSEWCVFPKPFWSSNPMFPGIKHWCLIPDWFLNCLLYGVLYRTHSTYSFLCKVHLPWDEDSTHILLLPTDSRYCHLDTWKFDLGRSLRWHLVVCGLHCEVWRTGC